MKISIGHLCVKFITDLIFTCACLSNQTGRHVSRGMCSSTSTKEGVAVRILWPHCWCVVCVLRLGTTCTRALGVGQMQRLVPALLLLVPLAGRCLMDLSHTCCLDPNTPLCRLRRKKRKPLSSWFINPTVSERCTTTFEADSVKPLVLLWRWTLLTNWIHLPYLNMDFHFYWADPTVCSVSIVFCFFR